MSAAAAAVLAIFAFLLDGLFSQTIKANSLVELAVGVVLNRDVMENKALEMNQYFILMFVFFLFSYVSCQHRTTIRSLLSMHLLLVGLSKKAGVLWSLPGIPTVALTRSFLGLLYANVMNFVLLYRVGSHSFR